MTKHLPVLPTFVGLALMFMGYHFETLELKLIGGLYLAVGTSIHINNLKICRLMWDKQRTII